MSATYDLVIVGQADPVMHLRASNGLVCGRKIRRGTTVQQVGIVGRLHDAPIACPECRRLTN